MSDVDELVAWLHKVHQADEQAAREACVTAEAHWHLDDYIGETVLWWPPDPKVAAKLRSKGMWREASGADEWRGQTIETCGERIAPHIARHDPRDALARIDGERALLAAYEQRAEWASKPGVGDRSLGNLSGLEKAVRALAWGYRHRTGWQDGWAPHPTYGGPVTVRLNNGQHTEGHADLQLHSDPVDDFGRRLWSWDGTIRVDTFDTAMQIFQEERRDAVVMPDGTTAEALPCAVTEPDPVIEIQGIGPAPWDIRAVAATSTWGITPQET